MLDFRPGGERAHCQLTRADRIDRDFLFGNARHPVLAQGEPLRLAIGGHTGKPGLSPGWN